MASREELQKQLEETQKELVNAKGSKCEVYSRVVGYLRPVQGWNKGKKEEYDLRKTYDVETCLCKGEL